MLGLELWRFFFLQLRQSLNIKAFYVDINGWKLKFFKKFLIGGKNYRQNVWILFGSFERSSKYIYFFPKCIEALCLQAGALCSSHILFYKKNSRWAQLAAYQNSLPR